jgi:hypothetical protein
MKVKSINLLLFLCCLTGLWIHDSPAFSQSFINPPERQSLMLEPLIGTWVGEGVWGPDEARILNSENFTSTDRMVVDWILGHQFIRLEQVSTMNVMGLSVQYTTIVFIQPNGDGTATCHGFDSAGLTQEKRIFGDSEHFTVEWLESNNERNRLVHTFNSADTLFMALEHQLPDGTWERDGHSLYQKVETETE